MSPQRRAVAEVMAGDHVHLTADEVHELARQRVPEISRATVYNTLNELVEMGELLMVDVVDGPKRYDPNVSIEHDHLVCEVCFDIRDVPRTGPMQPVEPTMTYGFAITGIEITFKGICPECAKKQRRSADN
jgi:Fur family ferric uptake transcriptional regulator